MGMSVSTFWLIRFICLQNEIFLRYCCLDSIGVFGKEMSFIVIPEFSKNPCFLYCAGIFAENNIQKSKESQKANSCR